jgi:hypothetical protein
MTIAISKDFSETPGARYRSEGKFSGEEFRDTMLEPRFLEAQEKKEKLCINLDGGYGYPTSFLEEAFGGLARKYDPKQIINTLDFVSDDEPSLIEEIRGYIRQARKGEKK